MKIRWNLKTNKLFCCFFFLQLRIIWLFRLNDFLYWRKNIPVLPAGQECVCAVASMLETRVETWTWLLATSGYFGINITLSDLTAVSPGHLVDATQALSFSFSYCLLCCLFEFPMGGIPVMWTGEGLHWRTAVYNFKSFHQHSIYIPLYWVCAKPKYQNENW